MEVKFEIEGKVTILTRSGSVDRIEVRVKGPSPFPEMEDSHPGQYPAYLSFQARSGYGEEWVKQVFGPEIEVEVIRV